MKDTLIRIGTYIANRAKEISTWQSLILVLAAFGTTFSEEQKLAILAIGMFIAGLLGAAFPDRIGANTRSTDEKESKP